MRNEISEPTDFDISQLLKALLPVDWCQSTSIINSTKGVAYFVF